MNDYVALIITGQANRAVRGYGRGTAKMIPLGEGAAPFDLPISGVNGN